ncbi:hypothetical protein [Streptomyces chiangmaiensis]|uniref:Uncharacterized protein n=1 Tax=Streptomyces chiangmaiensis TaxID=766497 RepID=A0ABU7FCJ8_9ACTN|nr:hypothetical protein [Streptomyces chiangmaiensis]MED7821073.1 hypothetical protein [Streptomyces chiangmaiensis]
MIGRTPHAGSRLRVISLITVSVVLVLHGVAEVLAVTTGRVVPWQRKYVRRPRLSGRTP